MPSVRGYWLTASDLPRGTPSTRCHAALEAAPETHPKLVRLCRSPTVDVGVVRDADRVLRAPRLGSSRYVPYRTDGLRRHEYAAEGGWTATAMQVQRNRERSTERSVGCLDHSDINVLRGRANVKGINMRSRLGKGSDPLVWIPGLALSVFCATGLATHLGWIPTPIGLGDRPAVRPLRAPPQELPRPAIPVTQAASIALPTVPCTECGVMELAALIGRTGEPDGAGAFWPGNTRGANAEALTSGYDSFGVLIAWHVCARAGGGCD